MYHIIMFLLYQICKCALNRKHLIFTNHKLWLQGGGKNLCHLVTTEHDITLTHDKCYMAQVAQDQLITST